jgi:hypothetical protein
MYQQADVRREDLQGKALPVASAIPEQIIFCTHHLATLHDRLGVPDSPSKTLLLRSSQGARPRVQRQNFRRTLSNHEMLSNRDMFVFKLNFRPKDRDLFVASDAVRLLLEETLAPACLLLLLHLVYSRWSSLLVANCSFRKL